MNLKQQKIVRIIAAIIALILVFSLLISLVACSKKKDQATDADSSATQSDAGEETPGPVGDKIVNIGVTNVIGSLNPLLLDATEVNKYAISLMFLPLVDLDNNLDFVPQIASEITTEDNLTFTIKVNPEIKWSDGEQVDANDVIFTLLKLTSTGIGNVSMGLYSIFDGWNESGYLPDDATLESVPGLNKVDDMTLTLTSTTPMPLTSFLNTYARYMHVIPEHKLNQLSIEELKTTDWFNNPEVVSGAYRCYEVNMEHFASYEANPNYYLGAPKINKLNIKVVQGNQLLPGLKTGEIDFIQPTMASIPDADHEAIAALDNVQPVYAPPVTNQLLFINTESVSDVRARRAINKAINRQQILDGFLNGNGEIIDGFITSYSPYFDEGVIPLPFAPDEARALLEEAGWTQDRPLEFKINSGDPTFVKAANVVVEQLRDVGIEAKITTLDIGSLLEAAGSHDFDLLAVQYTMVPVDPYPDVNWLVTGTPEFQNWVQYSSETMNGYLDAVRATADGDTDALIKAYSNIDKLVQEDAPVVSLYVISPLGAVSKRLSNAVPAPYGFLLNVHEWDIE
ncbi:MAG: ABC transporter substrate-binding protein [Saccharofermentanales bacterium]|jgi:peptide/nickel transport system substrate-binding protein|nr:ABC transporter substrate-binding protein [Bacillota bacterium]NLB08535.1 ABC transporter substrate-binding protein [Clostridiales bacterium]